MVTLNPIKESIALPGAIIMSNNDISESANKLLITQLHINEVITGQDFDLRVAADPSYPDNIRILRRRLLVQRDLRETTNRELVDIVIYVRSAMVYVENNCFGPTGCSFYLAYLNWGKFGIHDTDLNRSCED